MTEILKIDIDGYVAVVTLNRPDRKNALSYEMFDALSAAGESLKGRKDVRAVVLTGAGGDFCSGLDTDNFTKFAKDVEGERHKMRNPPKGEVANWFQKPCFVWQELAVPVIAAIEGVCLGGGIQLALAADIRIAAPGARFSIMESKWGLVPDMGISQSLPKLVRADVAKELIMTARMFDATEAAALGLVTRLEDDPLAAARTLATSLAARSPQAIRGAKDLVDRTWTAPPGEGLKVEGALQADIIGSAEQIETVMAVMQKRPAVYE